MHREFYVHPSDIDAVRRAIARVTAKVPALTATVHPAETMRRAHYHEIEAAYGHIEMVLDGYSPITVHKVEVTVDLDPYLIGGWRLVARRTSDPDGADFVEWYADEDRRVAVPDIKRTACQACGRNVARSETFIIARGEEVLQVGGQCKDQYIPHAVIGYISQLQTLLYTVQGLAYDPNDQAGGGGGRYEEMWKVCAVIAHSISHLKSNPFVRSTDEWGQANADATWRVVKNNIRHGLLVEFGTSTPWTPEILECLNDLRNSDRDTDRDISAFDWCNVKGLAFLPSAVRSWMKRKADSMKPHVDPVMPPTGRVILEGTVTSQKMVSTDFGDTYKMLLDCGAYRVWGTVPGNLAVGLGDRVRLTATVQPKEMGFGFYSRPAKAEVIPA